MAVAMDGHKGVKCLALRALCDHLRPGDVQRESKHSFFADGDVEIPGGGDDGAEGYGVSIRDLPCGGIDWYLDLEIVGPPSRKT